ncbi:DNA polymerase III subunit gamma/tau [Pararhizobium mangrovi]|uniref:DNA polymerase III subunit gamma/tau n=2 Tax=Pararhizobium mangrovi TaxID=2590452 RepID=A0A506U219_9HYPH|nr:DNA polymerase III subunit gamma/tau [Pararhizobium mangrovi]
MQADRSGEDQPDGIAPGRPEDGGTGHRVLARKYRPRDFTDLIGQAPMVRTLTNAFETGRLAQAYMLTGVRGVGKTTTARILARALNYETATVDRPTIDLGEPGEHCRAIMEGRHVDVIEMDAASHTGIDDIREIIEQVRYRPVSARYKVYIIDEVHMLSNQAFNGLLKTLEEPPEHVKFIFATTEIRKVPITVLSRCQRFDLRRIDAGLLVSHLRAVAAKEHVGIDEESLTMIARAAEGSARDALSLLDQAIAHEGSAIEAASVRGMLGVADRSRIVDLFAKLAGGDVSAALAEFREQYDGGAAPTAILTDLADFTHLVTRLKFVASAVEDPALSEAERTGAVDMAERLSTSALSRMWQMLLKGIDETETASRPLGAGEMVLIRLAHAASLPSPEAVARRVGELADDPASAPAPTPREPDAASAPTPREPREPAPAQSAPATREDALAGRTNEPKETTPSARSPQAPRAIDTPPARMAASGTGSQAARALSPEPMERGSAEPEAEAAKPSSAPEAAPEPKRPALRSLADLAALAEKHRDITTKVHIRKSLRLGRIGDGRLEVGLTEDAPKSLLGDLKKKLEAWTGERWMITLSREATAPTMMETEAADREARVTDAASDPDIAAILERFPGARITDVRIAAGADELTDSEPDAGNILPEAPDDTDEAD